MKTFLPVFNGFYNTHFDLNNNGEFDQIIQNIQYDRKESGIESDFNIDDIDFNYNQYEIEVSILLCDIVKNILTDYIEKITFENIYSPKQYNFSNDSINCDIVPNIENIKAYIYANIENFTLYLKNNYKSCDGFISHYDYNFETWKEETKNFTDYSVNSHYLGAILNFIANNEGITEHDLFCAYVNSDIYFNGYVKNYDDIVKKQDGTLFEFLVVKEYSKNFAEYINRTFLNGLLDTNLLDSKLHSDINEYINYLEL